MIALYCTVILLFCGIAVTLFVVKVQKDKKRYKKLHQNIKENGDFVANENVKSSACDSVLENQGNKQSLTEKDEKHLEGVPKQNAEFENFSLEEPKQAESAKRNSLSVNPFDFEDDEDELEDKEVDDKFAEYERFLRQNLDLDDEEDKNGDENEEKEESEQPETDNAFSDYEEFLRKNLDLDDKDEEDDLRALRNFDYSSIKGKSESEIRQIIKDLPPKAQEILLSDILARKNWED